MAQVCVVEMLDMVHFLITSCFEVLKRFVLDGVPVAHYEAVEAEDIAQLPRKQVVILAGVDAIHLVVTANSGAYACLDGCLERWEVHFELSSLVDYRVLRLFVCFSLVIDQIFHSSHYVVALDAFYERTDQLRSQVRVFAGHVFIIPAVEADPHHIQPRSEYQSCSLLSKFLSKRLTILF